MVPPVMVVIVPLLHKPYDIVFAVPSDDSPVIVPPLMVSLAWVGGSPAATLYIPNP